MTDKEKIIAKIFEQSKLIEKKVADIATLETEISKVTCLGVVWVACWNQKFMIEQELPELRKELVDLYVKYDIIINRKNKQQRRNGLLDSMYTRERVITA